MSIMWNDLYWTYFKLELQPVAFESYYLTNLEPHCDYKKCKGDLWFRYKAVKFIAAVVTSQTCSWACCSNHQVILMFLLVSRIPSICMEVVTELYFRQTDELFSSDFWIFVLYHMKKGVKMATTQVKVTSWSPTYMPGVRYRVIFQTDSWAGLFRILKFFLYYIKKGVEMATTQVKVTSWSPTQWYVTWFYHHPFFCQFDCVWLKLGSYIVFQFLKKMT